MIAAVMVVALTPPKSNAPSAVSATTLPALTVQMRSSATQGTDRVTSTRDADAVRIDRSTLSRDNAMSLVGSPNAVSTGPSDPLALDIGDHVPAATDEVYVLTQSHTYAVQWFEIDRLDAPDGSAVINADGELLAIFVAGELNILVE